MLTPARIGAVLVGGLLAWVAATAAPSHAARSDFVGSEACGSCHPAELAAWKKSAHARASETLGPRVSDRRCLGCHATGDAPAGRPYSSGVGCESCHGAGAGYSPADIMASPLLARELGLRELATPAQQSALCNDCHRASTRIAPFDPVTAWKAIAH